jgi:hypothetical protein
MQVTLGHQRGLRTGREKTEDRVLILLARTNCD